MGTIATGNAAEASVLRALTAAGIHVLLPFGDGLHFDLAAVAPSGEIVRIQVKTGRVRKGCVEFNSSSTDHGHGQRPYRGRADAFAVHVPTMDALYMVPVDDCALYRGYLRLEEARNGQRRGVRRADDYSLDRWLERLAA